MTQIARESQVAAGPEHLPTLDGWRAAAISLVLFSHVFFNRGLQCFKSRLAGDFRFGSGQLGVDLFFGLSGLLITTRLLAEWDRIGKPALRPFYIRRVFRILPAAYFYLAVISVLGWLGICAFEWRGLASAAGFYANYSKSREMPLGFFWSLAVEEHFYLLYPSFLVLLGPRRRLPGTLIAAGLVILWRAVESRTRFINPNPDYAWQHTDVRLDGLLMGAAMAILLREPTTRALLGRWLTGPVVLLCLAVLVVATPGYNPNLSNLAKTVLIPCVLAGTILRPGLVLSRILQLRPVAWLGRVSYGVYLWNRLFFQYQPRWLHLRPAILNVPLNLVLCLAFVALSYYLFETPLMKLGRRLAKRGTSRLEVGEAALVPTPSTGAD